MSRVLVTGSQLWPEPDVVEVALDEMLGTPHLTLVHGGCPTGADHFAQEWAKKRQREGHSIDIEVHYALWSTHGRSAGMIRNAEMVKLNANRCLAFIHDNSSGSSRTEELARKAEIPTTTFRSYSTMGINDKNVVLEDVRLVFKNFEGREGKYNREGDRSFSVVLNDEEADAMLVDGWNVKRKPPREEGEENFNHLPIAVSFKGRPPRLVLITFVSDGEGGMTPKRTQLDEELCEMFDYADAALIDIIIRPYPWSVSGKNGIKAYLHAIYMTLNTDALEQKYAHIPEAGSQLAIEAKRDQLALESGDSEDDVEDIEVVSDTGWSK